ncbi:hypothetical protein ACKKBG_A30510 [Auxenochlorella protothecoides x Auxenochlorella symbiontica]
MYACETCSLLAKPLVDVHRCVAHGTDRGTPLRRLWQGRARAFASSRSAPGGSLSPSLVPCREPRGHIHATSACQQAASIDSAASCYGCGADVQTRNPAAAGFVPPDVLATKARFHQLDQLLCTRCQGLNHGAPIPGVADLAVQAAEDGSRLVTPEELRNKIMHLRTAKAFVVLLVDLVDVSGTLLPRLRDMVGANPVVVVGTKLDLMPAGVRPDQLATWLQAAVEFKGIRPVAVYLTSGRTNAGVAAAVAGIRSERQGRDVYLIGAANAGKSVFLRAMVREMADMGSRSYDPAAIGAGRRLPTASGIPGTTLGLIRLPVFSSGGCLVDTPGVHLHHRLPHALRPEHHAALAPRGRLRGRGVAVPPGGAVLWWGGCVRLHVAPHRGQHVSLTFFGPKSLHVAEAGGGEEAAGGLARGAPGAGGVDACGDRPPPPPAGGAWFQGGSAALLERGLSRPRRLTKPLAPGQPRAIADLAVSGLPGWVSVHGSGAGELALEVCVPAGVEVFWRPPLPVHVLA